MEKFQCFVILVFGVLCGCGMSDGFQDCPSLDIREITDFKLIENCTAIVGNLHIVLTFDQRNISNLSYPNLRFGLLYLRTDYFGKLWHL
jgi:hypothetical protein